VNKLAQQAPVNNTPISFEPYQELMLKALVYSLAHLPRAWCVWLTLDRSGRSYLEEEGLTHEDIALAVNAGVQRGVIMRKLIAGCPAIALKRLVQS
jgi:hypothetical protein